ncbi:MAG: NAD(P)H-dependent oxidoreductase [Alphaproteobacteria bacterium]|nr:NAD(P)H-dependent oxidoreductase [Alphaproteobacteria bacterium]
MNILLIDSSARIGASESRKLGERLATRFGEIPDATMCRRDVNQGLHVLSEAHLAAYYTPANQRTVAQKELIKVSDILIEELRTCDRLILTMPMYNFNIPASLKMWQDLVMREGETFDTVPTGIVGKLKHKKAYIIITTGGTGRASPDNMLEPLTRLFLSGIGIEDQTYIHADNLAYNHENSFKAAQRQIDELEI